MRRPLQPTLEQRQAAVDAFNARYAVGDTIHVWTGPREGDPVARRIREPGAVILSGHTPVVYVSDGGGCIALTHVRDDT